MDPIIDTPRLRCTLITKAGRGSPEFEWLHEIRSDEQTTLWSIFGISKSHDDTERHIQLILPGKPNEPSAYNVVYAVHIACPADPTDNSQTPVSERTTSDFIGLITLTRVDPVRLPLPEHLTIPASEYPTTLRMALGYLFLPRAWYKGYTAEAVRTVLDTCSRRTAHWTPWEKVDLQGIVNDENAASVRVMDKVGMPKRGEYLWGGKDPIWIGGEWRRECKVHVFGRALVG